MAVFYYGDQGFTGFVEPLYGPLDFQNWAVEDAQTSEQSMQTEMPALGDEDLPYTPITEIGPPSHAIGSELPGSGSAVPGTASPIEEAAGTILTYGEAMSKGDLLRTKEGDLSSTHDDLQLTVEHTVPDSNDTAPFISGYRNSLSSGIHSMIGGTFTLEYSRSGVDLWPELTSFEEMSGLNDLLPQLPLQRGDRLYINAAIVLLVPSRLKVLQFRARLNRRSGTDLRQFEIVRADYRARKLFGRKKLEMALTQAGPFRNACGCADQWMADDLLLRLTGRRILCRVNNLDSNRRFD